ncbi:MAG: hypothetical protein IJ897_03465 [Prevotella sp.]|nr:hypothetical protein [Prevotella sp.]
MKRLLTLLLLTCGLTTGLWALDRDTENYYILSSLQDWQDFASLAQTVPTINARMIADIDLGSDQTMIGSYATRYSGTFDGQGHTLTFNYNTSSMSIESGQSYLGAAPFRDIEGATIRNLRTAGSITADKIGASGLVGWAYGTNTIENCWSDVNIASSNNTADTFTGFVAFMYGTSINITDCIFTGRIQSTCKKSHSGFIGYHYSGTSALTNCLVILDEGSDTNIYNDWGVTFFTFDRFAKEDQSTGSYTNCYYYRDFGVVQGTKVTDEQLADGSITTALQAGRSETVWVQDGISGQPRLDVFNHPITTYEPYVHPTSQIINLSELTEDYIAQDGDVLTGTTSYSIQIAADATITLSDVTITNYRKSPIQCLGNATINIEDGSVNRLRDSDEDSNSYGRPALAFGPSGTTLTINGNTGRLIAIGGRLSSAIGCRDNRVAYGGLIINGGVISAHGNSSYTSGIGAVGADDSHGSSCGDITINGGTINAAASDGIGIGAGGPNSCGAITINGGTITSSAVRSTAIGGNCSKVAISGGDINASTTTSVGIGSSGVVYIEGGTIVASASGSEGVGISGDKGVLIRSSITSLTASKGPDAANAIQGATVYISANLNDVTEGNTRTLTPKASFDPETDIEQDGEGYYLIADVTNWKEFAILSQIETSPKGKLVADINLGDEQAMIGSFNGIFDGQGHTLTVNLTSTANVCGVFRYVADGATIQNLRIAGTINGAHRWIGGFVGEGTGTYYINNCISSVTINTTYSGDGVQGGFVAAQRGTLYMNDCIFNGVFNGPNAYTWGGFVGWYYGSSTLTNCLVLCDEYNVRMSDVATFIAMSGTLNNCYYKTPIGTAQGTQATAAELSDGTTATALQAGRAEEIWVQDPLTNQPMLALFAGKYTVPASGLGTFSAKAKFALPEGLEAYYCKNYDATEGAIGVTAIEGVVPAEIGVLLRGEPGETYTLTISDDTPATVTDNALVAVTTQTKIDQTSGDYTNFGLSNGTFKKVNSAGGTVKANRAYLHILTSALTQEATARGIKLVWDKDVVTGVNDVRSKTEDVRGDNDSWFTLSGLRLNSKPTTKGIYIVNGKKIFIN